MSMTRKGLATIQEMYTQYVVTVEVSGPEELEEAYQFENQRRFCQYLQGC